MACTIRPFWADITENSPLIAFETALLACNAETVISNVMLTARMIPVVMEVFTASFKLPNFSFFSFSS